MEYFRLEVRADRWVFTPVSARALTWVEKNLFGSSLVVDRGYVPCVIRALLAEGFAIVPTIGPSGIDE